jgi:hypothetical protein
MLMVVLRFCNASWATGILVYITQQDSKNLCFEDKIHKKRCYEPEFARNSQTVKVERFVVED